MQTSDANLLWQAGPNSVGVALRPTRHNREYLTYTIPENVTRGFMAASAQGLALEAWIYVEVS